LASFSISGNSLSAQATSLQAHIWSANLLIALASSSRHPQARCQGRADASLGGASALRARERGSTRKGAGGSDHAGSSTRARRLFALLSTDVAVITCRATVTSRARQDRGTMAVFGQAQAPLKPEPGLRRDILTESRFDAGQAGQFRGRDHPDRAPQGPVPSTRCSYQDGEPPLARWRTAIGLAAMLSLASTACGLTVTRLNSAQKKPNNVWVFFTVEKGDEPVAGLAGEDFQIYEDDELVSVYESKQVIQNPEVAAVMYTMLLLDVSGSITESGSADSLVDAATLFTDRVGKSQKVGVYAFDGDKEIKTVVPFTEAQGSAVRAASRACAPTSRRTRRPTCTGR
jgi:hypothetical protein